MICIVATDTDNLHELRLKLFFKKKCSWHLSFKNTNCRARICGKSNFGRLVYFTTTLNISFSPINPFSISPFSTFPTPAGVPVKNKSPIFRV